MARPIAKLKLGYFPLPIEEAQNIRALLLPTAPYAAIDPCVGDGTALIEITKDTATHMAGIELDADRAEAASRNGSGSAANRGPRPVEMLTTSCFQHRRNRLK